MAPTFSRVGASGNPGAVQGSPVGKNQDFEHGPDLDLSGEAIVVWRLFAINLYCDRTEQ
jgi:hypothetical protein